MIRIYIYKILYNNIKINVFVDEKMIEKYKLNDYKDFKSFIQIKDLNNIYKIDYQIKTLNDDNYSNLYKLLEIYQKQDFKNKIKANDFDIEEFGIDNFYVASYNFSLSNLPMENLNINKNFYINICEPLFKEDILLLKAIQLFYDPNKYKEMKNSFKINSNNIQVLLFGYRYCLNELSSKNKKGIYYPLYNSNNINYLKDYFYPGNDTKPNKIYSSIINHFKIKPNEGCYVCLCKNGGYYHSVKSGFPEYKDLNMICPKCKKPIGIVNRESYYRIFKDDNEINEIKKDKDKKNKLKEINFMTLEQYKEKYIYKEEKNEKGVFAIIDGSGFKTDNKVIRNLSQVSFRLLNYILYTHLLFARILTDKKREFDKYLPRHMRWAETLYECWNILKIELLKENIDSIDKFMSYIFSYLFPILNRERRIEDYESLIKFEDTLESTIQKIIKNYKEDIDKNESHKKKINEDSTSFINLLKEKYTSLEYKTEEFPFYEYFYYSDYLDEKNISEKLTYMNESRYPVLKKYLESKNNKEIKDVKNNYSLDNLYLFNSVLNLINEKYYNKISRENAEKKKLKDEDIYYNNKDLIDKFINFYNSLKIKDTNELSNNSPLCHFLIDDNNKYGKAYKIIYKNLIKEQNEKLENLLDEKIAKGIFDINCKNKINIQQINEKEIFTLSLPKNFSFIDILFNCSYRKILDDYNKNYLLYKEYNINYDLIEENMTDLLLKNKKLLNEDITEFIYNNELFNNQVTDIITLFEKRYNTKIISIYDKEAIYKFCDDNKNNVYLCKNMINDFINLIKYLDDKRIENNKNDITEETKIYELIDKLKDNFSNNFIKIFENNDSLTIDKTIGIFSYYIKLIYKDVKNEIKNYQRDLEDKSKKIIDNYFQEKHLINKKDFASAIRLFITLVLFLEEDKEMKIKANCNNIVNYLKTSDLWDKDIYNDNDFNKNLNELKSFNIQINQIVSLYDFFINNGEEYSDGSDDDRDIFLKKNKKEVEEEEEEEEDPFIESDDGDERL